jgi:hypothetical protein
LGGLLLLLLEVRLVLQGLLLVGRHVWLLRLTLLHALRRHTLRHWRRRRLLLFGGVDGGFPIDSIRVGWLGSIQTSLENDERDEQTARAMERDPPG